MDKIILERVEGRLYFPQKTSSSAASNLAHFLNDDVGSIGYPYLKEFVNSSQEYDDACGNYAHVEKIGNVFRIWFEYDYSHDIPGAEYFETTVEELNLILDKWQEVMEKLPAMVTIMRENGVITFTYE